ncbi:MAG TPA: hypothetical protein VE326_11180 [Candidatus Binatia bacterium]|nr:hypothetical protein [Candidatus Binatia bacterium]
MTAPDTRLTLSECPRCGGPTLTGWADGLFWRVDRYTVPPRAATVLRRYGVPVLVVDHRHTGLWAQPWTPDHDLTTPRRHLVAPHVCGSAHARGEEFR